MRVVIATLLGKSGSFMPFADGTGWQNGWLGRGARMAEVQGKKKLRCLLLSDNKPGHYNLSEGVAAALSRVADVEINRLTIKQMRWVPSRVLRSFFKKRFFSPKAFLKICYGVDVKDLPECDIVVSAGGQTLIANVATAQLLKAENIFCGSLRQFEPEDFSMVITSYARYANRPRHVAILKPSVIDPETLGRPATIPHFDGQNPPQKIALLIGGDAGTFHYTKSEWNRLLNLMDEVHQAWGSRWLVSTSRRTDNWLGDALVHLSKARPDMIETFIDYRTSGPGTLSHILSKADVILCTEDSSTMMSEAISARLPVIGLSPKDHSFPAPEREYRDYLLSQNWCRTALISDLDVLKLGQMLSEVTPLDYNPLDRLAEVSRERLPVLKRVA